MLGLIGLSSFDTMWLIASPVSPKAVVWKRRGRVMMHHFRISATKVRRESWMEVYYKMLTLGLEIL